MIDPQAYKELLKSRMRNSADCNERLSSIYDDLIELRKEFNKSMSRISSMIEDEEDPNIDHD